MTPRVSARPPLAGLAALRPILAAAAAFLTAGATAVVLIAAAPAPASATLEHLVSVPASPTECDPVALIVTGTMPDPCYHVIGAEIQGPEPLPTMGPIPAFGIRIRITVQEPNPLLEVACPAVIQPYKREFPLGRLPYGQYHVAATEYLVPFTQDSTGAPKDSSKLDLSFMVALTRECPPPAPSCYLLGFGPELEPDRLASCNGIGPPGGRACFDVTLMNPVPVGGLQTEIYVPEMRLDPSTSLPSGRFEPVSVASTPRADGFRVAWTAEGSRVKIVLFSATGGEIPAGRGPILHVCYAIGADTQEGVYPLVFGPTVVGDPQGGEIPPCPTFAEIVGRLCVLTRACDVNGDGASNVLDIISIVHCVLAGHGDSTACPDSIAARSDCNGDQALDVRDVICCVRKILAGGGIGGGGGDGSPPDSTDPGATRLGFLGDVEWTSATEGRATISIEPGDDFAGIQFALNAAGAVVRGLSLLSGAESYALDWVADPAGSARVMLYRNTEAAGVPAVGTPADAPAAGTSAGAADPISILVQLEPAWNATGPGRLEIMGGLSGTARATAAATLLANAAVDVPASPEVSAPMVMAARPNPFASETDIAFALPAAGRVTLRIYDAAGRLVRTLVDQPMPAGVHHARWDGRDQAGRPVRSGIYFSKFSAGGIERSDRILRLK
jgi:hypothetical protein